MLHYGQGFEGELRHWDVGFWAERLREAKYSISDEQLRPYFALPNVLNGLFQVSFNSVALLNLQCPGITKRNPLTSSCAPILPCKTSSMASYR